jgi:Holliday junction DNA helicase RuvA
VITRITGQLQRVEVDHLVLQVDSFEYEVLIPDFARRQLQNRRGENVSLHTIQYLEGNAMQGRLVPKLIGFLSEVEREFFDMICSVDGVGVKKALRAMVRPVREVATAIEEQDIKSLSALPGIGAATAERMVAKLRRKMPKFALLVDGALPPEARDQRDVLQETYDVLCSLGHSPSDARRLVDRAASESKKYKDVQELLHVIYRQSQN